MAIPKPNPGHESRLSRLEGVVEGLAGNVVSLIKHQEERDKAQRTRDEVLFRKLDEAKDMSRPQATTVIAGVSLLAVIVFGIYTPFAAGLNEKVANVVTQSQLADRLQTLQIEDNRKGLDEVRAWQADRIKADLNELQARRLRDSERQQRKSKQP